MKACSVKTRQLKIVTVEWRKTGDIKLDMDDRKAILMSSGCNPKSENMEEVVIHELLITLCHQ